MAATLTGRTILIIGRGSGIARAITLAVGGAGGTVVVAGRDRDTLASSYDGTGVSVEQVDLDDEASIGELAHRLGTVDHVVSTASARARGPVGDLTPETVIQSFRTKVVGPIDPARQALRATPAGRRLVRILLRRDRAQADAGHARGRRHQRRGRCRRPDVSR
jgi:NAD(P)-dependent dehydrogenase (short-subunit alcohol dehydrogenase family)